MSGNLQPWKGSATSFNYVGKFSTHHTGSRKEIARVFEIFALEFYFPKGRWFGVFNIPVTF